MDAREYCDPFNNAGRAYYGDRRTQDRELAETMWLKRHADRRAKERVPRWAKLDRDIETLLRLEW